MIFLSCKITEHDYLPRCGGGRSAGWWEAVVHWPQLARGQPRLRPHPPGAVKCWRFRGVDCTQVEHFDNHCWLRLLFAGTAAFCRNGHTWCCRWWVRDLEAFACPL
jgi:hypothetical protein